MAVAGDPIADVARGEGLFGDEAEGVAGQGFVVGEHEVAAGPSAPRWIG